MSKPYVDTACRDDTFTIDGTGLRRTQGTGQVTLDGSAVAADRPRGATRRSRVTRAAATPRPGRTSSTITAATTATDTVNGLTFHVLGGALQPARLRGGSRQRYGRGQSSTQFDRELFRLPRTMPSSARSTQPRRATWSSSTPNNPSANPRINPRGAYYENLIITIAGEAAGRRPGRLPGHDVRSPARSSTAAPSAATARWRPTGDTKIGGLHLGRQPDVNDGEVIYVLPAEATAATRSRQLVQRHTAPPSTASTCAAATSRASPATSTTCTARRPACRSGRHPGRRDLRERLRPQPADHQQHRPEQRRRATGRSASARPTCPPDPTTTRTDETSASRTTGSSPTPAPTWPAASASSRARTATTSRATTSAATSRPSTAAASPSTA